jgi:hypothetical protein
MADLRTIVWLSAWFSLSMAIGPLNVNSSANAFSTNASETLTFGRVAQPLINMLTRAKVVIARAVMRLYFSALCALCVVIVYLRSGSICGVCRVDGSFVEISALD